MIPEDLHPKPVYRKLVPRTDEELRVLTKELERIRKSLDKGHDDQDCDD